MLRTGYAVNATHVDGRVVFLDGFPTEQRARDLAEYVARQSGVRRVSWGEVRDGGYYATASAVVPAPTFVVVARRVDHPVPFEVTRTDDGVAANRLASTLSAQPHIASATVTLESEAGKRRRAADAAAVAMAGR